MYIKSVEMDGFKSYGRKVIVDDFDPCFNAITGLNGTGKSNILDAICFILGITNYSNMRVGSLTELIFRNGQAGVNKASVSVTFDNRNPLHKPVGLEGFNEFTVTRQVVLGGKSRYFLNGSVVLCRRVQDLFAGVQLNINNPHFLIMQGRITKVLNMKPHEVLSLVEEAAGTRMYETKKNNAQKTIVKKEAKLKELNEVISESIAPRMHKLHEEQNRYQEYQTCLRELENLIRVEAIWRYVTAENGVTSKEILVQEALNNIREIKEKVTGRKRQIKEIDEQIADKRKELQVDETADALRKQIATAERAAAESNATVRAAEDGVKLIERRLSLLGRSGDDDRTTLVERREALRRVEEAHEQLSEPGRRAREKAELARAHFMAVSSGQEEGSSLHSRLMDTKKIAMDMSIRVQQNKMEEKHCEETLRNLRREWGEGGGEFLRENERVGVLQSESDDLGQRLRGLIGNESIEDLAARTRTMANEVRGLKDGVDRLSAGLGACNFHYVNPEPEFDRRRVFGPVCRQLRVNDAQYTVALDTVAGGKLTQVIVDSVATSRLLLERGGLRQRTTIIPLDKIRPQCIEARKVALAQELGGGRSNVQLALDLVTYPQELKGAMEYVFGGTLVCRDLNTAKTLAYHPQIRRRCVTFDGDSFDPSGSIVGGAREGPALLEKLAELTSVEDRLRTMEEQLRNLQQTKNRAIEIKTRYDTVLHELRIVSERQATTNAAQLNDEIKNTTTKLEKLRDDIQRDEREHQELLAKVKELEHQHRDLGGHRDRQFKKAENELKAATKAAERITEECKQHEQALETIRLEIAELERGVANTEEQIVSLESSANNDRENLERLKSVAKEAAAVVEACQKRFASYKASLAERNSEVGRMQKRKEALSKEIVDCDLEEKRLELRVEDARKEARAHKDQMEKLLTEHPWLGSGRSEDVERPDMERLARLAERRDMMARSINRRAHTLLGKETEEFALVEHKRTIVVRDRVKLYGVMTELDTNISSMVEQACDRVSEVFASMFSTLLPGAMARLELQWEGERVVGLEMHVGFNGVWKQSLSELSGGQRSLVALSLVLALLIFRPAPVYILDEVDAALDLAHTQNIGEMLRKHFAQSQFIIVSLKEGMFNNANVLFRTHLDNGASTVQRFSNLRN